ncbi:MAG TPA: DUF5916 domain-containing protein [Thermoanaerobaculia bacterium]|nr:DUF5916 domain-containing protein [Thermoanaerobaculia bacterium]
MLNDARGSHGSHLWALGPAGLIAGILLASPLAAWQPPPGAPPGGPPPLPPRPSVAALPISSPIHVDGVLDDEAWQRAEAATGFTQREPQPGAPASEMTEVRVAYTNTTLYVAIRALAANPKDIVAEEMQRDGELFRDDSVIVFLDTFNDNRNAYWFETNANGARTDALLTDEGRFFNVQWDGVWDVVARRNAEGWAAELAIPFSTLRFDPHQDTWGFQVRRLIRHRNEEAFWASIPLEANLFRVSLAGSLTGIRGPEPGLNLRLKPFGVAQSTKDTDFQGVQETDEDIDGGLDAKWGITRTMTLDLTYNTDFAETEVDEQQINLTRFSLFFPEKREFFLENAGLFEFGFNPPGTPLLETFFSRKLGIDPFGAPVPIDWGARLTGRAGPWSLGMVDVQTDQTDVFPFFTLPETNWGTVRVKRDIGQRSTVGMIATNREASGGDVNRVIGLDAEIRPTQRLGLSGFYAESNDPGPAPGKEWAGGARAFYQSNTLGWGFDAIEIGDAFDPQVGFLLRSGIRRYVPRFTYEPRPALAGIRNLHFAGLYDLVTDLDDRTESRHAGADLFGLRLQTEDFFTLFADSNLERVPVTFDIGGVLVTPGTYDFDDAGIQWDTNSSRRLYSTGYLLAGDFYDGDRVSSSVGLGWRASRYLRTDTTWVRDKIDLENGAFTSNIVRQRIGLSFTPRLSTSTYVQYADHFDLLSVNFRLNWIYRPGSDIFLVFNQNWDAPTLSDLSTSNRAVILKLTYLLEL